MPEAHAQTWPLNPFAAETTYKAMLWDRANEKTKKATVPGKGKVKNKKVIPVTPPKTVKRRSTSGGARKDPGKMSGDEYAVWYRKKYGKN